MGTALVTGASSGLGLEFARELARRRQDLVLVARNGPRLRRLAAELRGLDVQVEVLVADLAERDQLQLVAERVADPDRPVGLLVNNAGYGLGHGILASTVAEEEALLDVLCRAVLVLSHAAGGAMVARGHGAIVNVSSVAAYTAYGSYSAAKSWVLVFSEALAAELRGTGVTVTALCPGFVRTEFQQRAGLTFAGMPSLAWLDAATVVREGLRDVARGSVISVPTWRYRLLAGLLRAAPRRSVRARDRRTAAPRPR